MILFDELSVTLSTLVLIALAEIGDKSQLVCMTLAVRHRAWPILLGATTAFLILNALAVLFGSVVAAWVPERLMAGMVALLFGAFGVHALLSRHETAPEGVVENPSVGIFFATLLLILVAEFGDKTQISVAALAASLPPLQVMLGATVGLIAVSALGVWAGRTVLQRLPIYWLHRGSGGIFLLFALIASLRAFA